MELLFSPPIKLPPTPKKEAVNLPTNSRLVSYIWVVSSLCTGTCTFTCTDVLPNKSWLFLADL